MFITYHKTFASPDIRISKLRLDQSLPLIMQIVLDNAGRINLKSTIHTETMVKYYIFFFTWYFTHIFHIQFAPDHKSFLLALRGFISRCSLSKNILAQFKH